MTSRFPLLHSVFRLTMAVAGGIIMLVVAGFILFFVMVATGRPDAPESPSDVVIVLTGGPGRIEAGLDLMAQDRAKSMLITGVHPNTTLQELVARWQANPIAKAKLLSHCCIAVGHMAESTEENAIEARDWLRRNGGWEDTRVRMVTSDYHVPRAYLLFKRAMPEAEIDTWPVPSAPVASYAFLRSVAIEYSKTFLTWLS